MKKLALVLMAVSATLFGFGMVAEAQYGTATGTFTVTPPNPGAGTTVTFTVTGCTPGETLTFTLNNVVLGTAVCQAPARLTTGAIVGLLLPQQAGTGSATFTTTVPTTPGTYTYTVTGNQGFSRSTVVTVAAAATPPAGGLPATGSGGINQTMMAAAGLFAVGLGLFAVTLIRRRQSPSLA